MKKKNPGCATTNVFLYVKEAVFERPVVSKEQWKNREEGQYVAETVDSRRPNEGGSVFHKHQESEP